MPECIFCASALDRQTKPEHVLLNALGGRKTTTQVICSECNNQFGNGIDKAFSVQVEVIRNLLQMKSGTSKFAPMLKKVQAGSEIINMRGDGTLERVVKPFSISERSDGKANIEINVASLEELDRLIPSIAAALRLPEADVRRQLSNGHFRMIEQRPGSVQFPLSFGGHDAIRSAAKACLVLWALQVGNTEICRKPYEAAKSFVLTGSADFLKLRTTLDSRLLNNVIRLKELYGPLFNLIYVRSNYAGRVIGHFTFCNVLGFQIVLAESGGVPNERIGLISNPLSPSDWSDQAAAIIDIPFDWLDDPHYDETFATQRERLADVMKTYIAHSIPKELYRIVDEVCVKYGLSEDAPIPLEILGKLTDEIGMRIASHALGSPYEKTVTAEEIRAVLARRPSEPN